MMWFRYVYNEFAMRLAGGLIYAAGGLSDSYNNFYSAMQSTLNNLTNSPYFGVISVPIAMIILWLFGGINIIVQWTVACLILLANNIDIMIYFICALTYLLVLFLFVLRFIRSFVVQVFLIQLIFIPIVIFLVLNGRGDPNPAVSTRELCLNFFDYFVVNYGISLYLFVVIAIIILSLQYNIAVVLADGSPFALFVMCVGFLALISPIIIILCRFIFQGVPIKRGADEAQNWIKGVLRIE